MVFTISNNVQYVSMLFGVDVQGTWGHSRLVSSFGESVLRAAAQAAGIEPVFAATDEPPSARVESTPRRGRAAGVGRLVEFGGRRRGRG